MGNQISTAILKKPFILLHNSALHEIIRTDSKANLHLWILFSKAYLEKICLMRGVIAGVIIRSFIRIKMEIQKHTRNNKHLNLGTTD